MGKGRPAIDWEVIRAGARRRQERDEQRFRELGTVGRPHQKRESARNGRTARSFLEEDMQDDLDSIRYAAHMPKDYEYGLASWINQTLYACYIGASISPHITELIESGKLTFPNSPIERAARHLLFVIDKAPYRLTAQTFGQDADEAADALKELRAVLNDCSG